MLILGLDPSLSCTGWGIVRAEGNRLTHIANGQIPTDSKHSLPERLAEIHAGLRLVLHEHRPQEAAIEEMFVNKNAQSSLKLAHARGVAMLVAAKAHMPVTEYAARVVKKCVVGSGAADKQQVQAMVKMLLPGVKLAGADAADALGVAITHAHHRSAPR